ncbi:MAG: nucleotidyltransferase domain-containing protein [Cyanobacteria bacterium Co-bin8]|nr:nucleotidyltransferase domain-containing protein [Cyanobacteria bacterium Co-bin8]
MAKTVRQLTEIELQQFNPTQNLENILNVNRWEMAQSKLPRLLAVLREDFGAKRIVVFGSLAAKDNFTHWSDIDLAAWGIVPERFYDAVAALNDLSPDIKVDLVDPERCGSPRLKQIIEEEGVEV